MKIAAIYDEQGTISAASPLGDGGDEPVPGEGEHFGEFEVPDEVSHLGIGDICQRFRVDVDAQVLTAKLT